jgi:hypothetical protein
MVTTWIICYLHVTFWTWKLHVNGRLASRGESMEKIHAFFTEKTYMGYNVEYVLSPREILYVENYTCMVSYYHVKFFFEKVHSFFTEKLVWVTTWINCFPHVKYVTWKCTRV